MTYVLHNLVVLCFILSSYDCVRRCENINFMLQSLNFEFNYKHLYLFLNLHLFCDGEVSTTKKRILNYSFSLTNINVPTQYRVHVLYYSTLIIIISFVYSGVYTYSQFISACTLSCEKEMCFLLLTHFTTVNQLIMYRDILLELCVLLYIYSWTQENVIYHNNSNTNTDYHLCFTRVMYLLSLLSEMRYMYIYFYYTLSCALGFFDLSTSILMDRSKYTMFWPVALSKQESMVGREGDNRLLVVLIVIFSLTINCVIFMLDDIPFDVFVTRDVVLECSSPYNFRTIHSEHAPTVIININLWMGLNQSIIALFYKYDNFILSMCNVNLHLICYSYSLFYHMVYLSFPWLTKLHSNFILKREYAFNTHSSFNILLGYNNYYVDQASCFLVCVKLLKYNHGVVKMVCGNTQCMKLRSFIHLFKYSSYVHRSWYVYNSTRLYYCIFYYINLIRLYYSWLRRDRYHACANIVQSHYFKKGCLFYIVYAMVLSNYIKYG